MTDQSICTLRGHGGNSISSVCFLSHDKLASCDDKGDNLLVWDISRRRTVFHGKSSSSDNGSGLSIVKCKGNFADGQFLYQQKNNIALYDCNTLEIIHSMDERSFGFCKAAAGQNFIVYPSSDYCSEAGFKLWDQRTNPSSATKMFATSDDSERRNNFGMMTSISICDDSNDQLSIACGMDSGDVLFQSLRMNRLNSLCSSKRGILSIGKEPVLSLDLVKSTKEEDGGAIVGVAGLAGNIADMSNYDEKDRGTLVLFKMKSSIENNISCKIRKRILTCPVDASTALLRLKPSIACSKFRGDGKVFGITSWDRRTRIYSRAGKLLAILKGHNDSVNCLDWQPFQSESETSFIATGSSDGCIKLWDISL